MNEVREGGMEKERNRGKERGCEGVGTCTHTHTHTRTSYKLPSAPLD